MNAHPYLTIFLLAALALFALGIIVLIHAIITKPEAPEDETYGTSYARQQGYAAGRGLINFDLAREPFLIDEEALAEFSFGYTEAVREKRRSEFANETWEAARKE